MNSPIELLHQTAARLRQEGKKPSLALFKARLAGQLTAPALFSAYQLWRQQTPTATAEPQQQDFTEAAEPENLTKQLQRIENKLDSILALLEQRHVSG
jgi:hypothetical protein